MIIDNQLELSDAQEPTTGATPSEDVADLGALKAGVLESVLSRQLKAFLHVEVGVTFTSGGAGTLAIAIQDAAVDGSFTTILTTPALAKGLLVKGFKITFALPVVRRYVRVLYTIATADMTAGALNASMVLAADSNMPSE